MGRIVQETLLAIDPGVTMSGWAVFLGQKLVEAGLARAKRDMEIPERVQAMLAALVLVRQATTPRNFFDTVVVEYPMVYPGRNAVGDPNDIVAVSYAAGAIAHAVASKDTRVIATLPRNWKGTIPKNIHHQRLQADHPKAIPVVKRSGPSSMQHHVWDAVGLGFWQLERTRA